MAAGLALPASIVGIQLDVTPGGNLEVAESGTVDVRSLEASTDDDGDAWTPLPVEGGRTVIAQGGGLQEVDAPAPLPERVEIPALFGTERVTYRRLLAGDDAPPAAILVNDAFLDRTGAAVGDTLQSSVFGAPLEVEILDTIDGFPTLDPGKPFALVDIQALGLLRLAAQVASGETAEWWLATEPGRSAAVAAGLAAAPIEATGVVDRTAVEGGLVADPLGLGVIGILGLGSLAALVFAAIGYLVSVSVSTTERLGELALLKALGLAPRQLLAWLSVENVALLVVGLGVGVLLGLLLRLARAAVRDAHLHGRDTRARPGGRGAARGAAADAGAGPPARRRDGRARAVASSRRPGRARSCARGTSRWAGPGSPSAASATTVPRRSGSRCSCSSRRSSPPSRRG